MPKKICAEIVVDFLTDKKIDTVFDLSGGMIAFMEDAISRREGIECFPMHHEQAAGFAAEGYSRKGQNFGVAMATSGPGATNLLTAIGSCYFDSIPAMFIVGQVHSDNLKKNENIRQEGFQETNIVNIVKPITKYAVLVLKPENLIYELEKAHFIMAQGRPGSVLVDIPINIQRTEVDIESVSHFIGSGEHQEMIKMAITLSIEHTNKKVDELKTLLHSAKAPLVIIGNGVRLSNTKKELADFVKRNNTPVVTSLLGIDSYAADDMLVGYIGSNGNRDANIVFANADFIIALGTRLDIRQTGDPAFFNKNAKIVHVDIDKVSIDYTIKSHLSFEMDLKNFFTITKDVTTQLKPKWFDFVRSVQTMFPRLLVYESDKVDPNTMIHEISNASSSGCTVTADVGQNQMWCAQSWKVKDGQRVLFSGGMGAMGFALPASIGAWCSDKNSDVVVICGDGGLQINIQELETAGRNNIPMKLFIFNNKSLGMVREFQDLYFNKNYQSTVVGYGCPDLKKTAEANGFDYVKISRLEKDDPTIKDFFKKDVPVLVEVIVDIHAQLLPKIVYGHALDDQAPYLNPEQKMALENLKKNLYS